jgi:Ca-activated chloride channel family protein
MVFLIIAIANPQIGTRIEKGERKGSDIAICLDLSNSMMAEDIQPNRLQRSKMLVANLLSSFTADRVSLVAFAGTSFIQMPLTNDYNATRLFLDDMDCSLISSQGTAIGDAIEKALLSFGYDDPDREWDNKQGRAIIVISDGENHEDDAVAAARRAANLGVRVCTIGIGSTSGAPIPEYDPRGRKGGYKRESGGSIIMTRLNEDMLRDIAKAGDGVYISGGNVHSSLSDITDLLDKLQKNDYGEAQFAAYESRYMYPLTIALVCFLAEVLIFARRNRKLRSLLQLPILLLFLIPATGATAQANRHQLREGNRQFRKEHYDKAEINYRRALERDSNDAKGQYNLGSALYRQEKYQEAADHFSVAQSPYAVGNSYAKMGSAELQSQDPEGKSQQQGLQHLQQAAEAYKQALRSNPKDDNARYNLAYVQRLIRQNQQQQSGGGGGGQDQEQQDKQDKQNQQGENNQDKQQQQQQQNQSQSQQQQNKGQEQKQDQQNNQAKENKKQDDERLLQAVQQNERQTMRNRTTEKVSIKHTDKDW